MMGTTTTTTRTRSSVSLSSSCLASSSLFWCWTMALLLLLLLPITTNAQTATPPETVDNTNCRMGTEKLMNQTTIAQAEENVLKAVDPLLCEQGNRQDTRVVCGTDYARDATALFDAYKKVCLAGGGQFQTATTGVECSHDVEREIDYDWINIPHCVDVSCPPNYAQISFNTSFFQGYRKSQEENNFTCQFTTSGSATTTAKLLLVLVSVVASTGTSFFFLG